MTTDDDSYRESAYWEQVDKMQQEWIDQFKREHPAACLTCFGTGGVTIYQTHAPGMTEAIPDVCPDCIGRDKCPQCGCSTYHYKEKDFCVYFVCDNCGFSE